MGGKFSRDKGARGERSLRDYLRKLGWEADRIPLSGASKGFKGDVRGVKAGQTVVFELKCRKDAFKRVYDLFHHFRGSANRLNFCIAGHLISMTPDFERLLESAPPEGEFYAPAIALATQKPVFVRTFSKILAMHKLLQEADYLVIKDDNKPFLFLRYK